MSCGSVCCSSEGGPAAGNCPALMLICSVGSAVRRIMLAATKVKTFDRSYFIRAKLLPCSVQE